MNFRNKSQKHIIASLYKRYTLPCHTKERNKPKPMLVLNIIVNGQELSQNEKHENLTMCIVHSTLRDATTPYTNRWA